MAARTKAPVTGQLDVLSGTLTRAIDRIAAAKTKTVSIRATGTGVLLCSDGYDTALEVTLDCEYDGALACVVDHKTLRSAARTMPKNARVIVQQDRDHLRLTAGTTVVAIDLLNDEPRQLPAVGDAQQIVWAVGAQLRAAIEAVAHSASKEDHRPLLMGVLLESGPHTSDGRLIETQTAPLLGAHVVACDSYRLAAHPLPGADGDFRVVADARVMLAAVKGLTDTEGVTVSVGTRPGGAVMVEVVRSGERWQVPTPYGNWPLWRSLVPDSRPIHFTVDRAELMTATALAAKHQGGEASMTYAVPAAVKTLKAGESLGRRFGIDPTYLHAAVKHLAADTIRGEYNGPLKPVKLIGGDTVEVIMPVRLDAGPPTAKNKVPLQVQITDTDVVLSMDAYTPLTPPEPQSDPEQVAKDLADLTGNAKRAATEVHSGTPCPTCGSKSTQKMSDRSVYCSECKTTRSVGAPKRRRKR